MKKVLLSCMMLLGFGGVASAQEVSVITNGDFEGDGTTSFIVKEYPSTDLVEATIIDGIGKDDSKGVKVVSADETEVSGTQAWDTQFWIVSNQALPAGTKYTIAFDYKASKAAKVSTQAHNTPGNYIFWGALGDVNFTTEWKHFAATGEISADQSPSKNFLSWAFNLNEEKTEVTYYFDNIVFTVELPEEITDWTDLISNGDMETNDSRNFYTKNAGETQANSLIEDGIGKDDSRGIRITTLKRDWIEDLDTDGNQQFDGDGNVKMKWSGEDWDAQFFIRLPQALPAGTKYKVSFDYKSSVEGRADTQAQNLPGGYIHWAAIGSPTFKTEWQSYYAEGTISADMSKESEAGAGDWNMRTIAFNLSCNHEATEFFIDNIKFEIPTAALAKDGDGNVINELPDPVVVKAPVVEFTVDESGWATFSSDKNVEFASGVAYAAAYDAESGSVKLYEITELPAGSGAIIKGAGNYEFKVIKSAEDYYANNLKVADAEGTQSEGAFYCLTQQGTQVGFAKVAAGVTIPAGKCYLEISAPAREFIGLFETTGIKTVGVAEANEVIFNLAGQRMMKAQKGVNIINGKKLFVK